MYSREVHGMKRFGLFTITAAATVATLGIVAPASAANLTPSGKTAAEVYAAPTPAAVREQAVKWVASKGVKDEAVLKQVGELWGANGGADEGATPSPRVVFARVIKTFQLVDADAKTFVDGLSLVKPSLLPPNADVLEAEGSTEFFTNNMRLHYARYLTQRKLYDEALEQFDEVDARTVVDPATSLFHQAVCEHQLMQKDAGLETIGKLLKSTEDVPASYASVASLMEYELQNLKEDSLDEVARIMQDVERRLDLARGGQRVQKQEDEVIVKLDEIIKKLEECNCAGCGDCKGAGKGKKISTSPAKDSKIMGGKGPGEVKKERFADRAGWGDLPKKAQAKAKQDLGKNFPPHYKRAIAEFYKKQAEKRRTASR